MTTMVLLCVCDEDWCWCPAEVEVTFDPTEGVPDVACGECAAGFHVWRLDGPRERKAS